MTRTRTPDPTMHPMESMWRIADSMPGLTSRADMIAFAWTFLAKPAEKAAHDQLVAEHNHLVDEHNARVRAERDAREAERDRRKLRAALCPHCFTVHAPGQEECS